MRLIAVGCGRVFERYHLPALRASPDVRLVGTVEVDAARRAWVRGAIPRVPCHDSLDDALRSVDVDAVLVSTSPATHATFAESVLRAGLAVLVEKPMAVTADEARRVCDLRRRTGSVLRVGFNRRYRREYARLRDRIGGPCERVTFTFIADAGRWNPGAAGTPAFVLHDAGSHAMDLVAHLAVAPVARLRATDAARPGTCTVTIEADLRGGTSVTSTVGHAPGYRESLAVVAGGHEHRVQVSATVRSRVTLAVRKLTGRPTPTAESFRAQLAGFVRAWRGNPDDVGAGAADGLAAVCAIEAALRSLTDGGTWQDVAPAAQREDDA